MLIRRNTKLFKTILEIIQASRDRPDREKLIRLYITKAGDTVHDRISIEGIEGGAGLFYEMNYQAVVGNLKSPNHQLHESDEMPGVYFFHSSSNKVWDETPFEFDEAIKKEFGDHGDLPVVRKKEKVEKFTFPAPNTGKKTKSNAKEKAAEKEEKEKGGKSARVVQMWPKQPDYGLKHDIYFTGLERIAIRQAQLTKKDVLDYYNKISDHLLPYLKGRPLIVYLPRDGSRGKGIATLDALKESTSEEIPSWIKSAAQGKGKTQEQLLVCDDREHLLFYVQLGCVQFHVGHSKIRSLDSPDYLILTIESPDYDLPKTVDAALAVKEVLDGLRLPSGLKADGASGLHVYIPLDSKSDFEKGRSVAKFLCKLVRLKNPEVTLKGLDDHAYGKVSLGYSMNSEGEGVVAPYSLVVDQAANVAAPLMWEEVEDGLKAESFNHETIFARITKEGDLFQVLSKKKIDAKTLLQRLDENYSFLL